MARYVSERPIHVEMYDGETFCETMDWDHDGVMQGEWQTTPTAVAKANCMDCLDRLCALGTAAHARRHRLRHPRSAKPAVGLTRHEAQTLKRIVQFAHDPHAMDEPSEAPTAETVQQLGAALDRVTVQPTFCTHDAWEWPMQACPHCGHGGNP